VSDLAPGRTDVLERRARLGALGPTLSRRDVQIARLARRSVVGPEDLTAPELRRFWNYIGASPLVTQVDDAGLGLLLDACEVQHWTPQSVVVRAGQTLPRCYCLVEGYFEATRVGPRGTLPLLRFLPGDVIGDRALVGDAPWPVEVRTGDGETTAALRWTRRRIQERSEGRFDELLAVLARHGRDRDVEALLAG
jgi:CRP-like cAMP-binding protein